MFIRSAPVLSIWFNVENQSKVLFMMESAIRTLSSLATLMREGDGWIVCASLCKCMWVCECVGANVCAWVQMRVCVNESR